MPATEAVACLMIGQTLGHYRIIDKIGAGGMGEVYRAHDEQLERDVALKVLPTGTLANDSTRKQFRKEALALAKLNHPNIETVYEFSSAAGVDFLAMELIPGHTLSEKLKNGPLAEREIVRLSLQMAEGLSAAHQKGIVHRDLKPGNLMITPEGRLKILDFGLARLMRDAVEPDVTRSVTQETGVFREPYPTCPRSNCAEKRQTPAQTSIPREPSFMTWLPENTRLPRHNRPG